MKPCPFAPIEPPSLFPGLPATPAVPLSPPPRPSPPPQPAITADTLLAEIEGDWWSLLDPRNWRDPGPTDKEILARYHAAGTPAADEWPNVSGHRMYSCVWPALQQTYHVPEDRLLAACQACRRHHLQDALASTRTHAIDYSISADLLGNHIWNGDSWATYTALAHFANQPTATLESFVTEALQVALHNAIAAFHTALATRYRPPVDLRPSKHANAEQQAQVIQAAITHARARLTALRGHLERRDSRDPHHGGGGVTHHAPRAAGVGRCHDTRQIAHVNLGPEELVGHGAANHGCRSEEHTSELQSPLNLVCRLLLE